MNSPRCIYHNLFVLLTLVGLVGSSLSVHAQNKSNQGAGSLVVDPVVQRNFDDWVIQKRGLPDDWSHHHHVFSNPGTAQQATENGTFEHWLKITNGHRFTMQLIKHAAGGAAELRSANFSGADKHGNGPSGIVPGPNEGTKAALTKDWSMNMSGGAATLTGTVSSNGSTASSTVTVDGVTLNASAPTAATQTGTFSGNPTSGQTVTIGGSEVLTASLSTTETATITLSSSSRPANNSSVQIGSIVYTFVNAATVSAPGTNACSIRSYSGFMGFGADSTTTVAMSLYEAITNGGGGGNSTWQCGTTPNSAVTATLSSRTISLTATTYGSAGFIFTDAGTTNFTAFSDIAGTDGTNTGTYFRCDNNISDNAANLAAAIMRNGGTVGVTATSTSATLTVTASTAGTGGNSISLTEGLSNFIWSASTLSGGSAGTTSGTAFAYSGLSATQLAANIATAINLNTTLQTLSTGVSATSSGTGITVTSNAAGTGGNSYTASANLSGFSWNNGGHFSGGTATTMTGAVGPGMFPAKYSFDIATANCAGASTPDYVVYNTRVAGTATQASIVAYDNLYTGTCAGTVPTVYWAYNTAGTIPTSLTISEDGSQLAFVHSTTSGAASLVLLKWASGSGTVAAPVALASVAPSAYANCATPCMTVLPAFADGKPDTNSSPYLDYDTNTLYVGDDGGYLHKFTGIFTSGTPVEVGSPWPIKVSTNKLTGPVYDQSTQQVFVADSGGFLYSYNVATGALVGKSSQLAATGSKGIVDAPLLDSSAGTVYVAVAQDGNTSTTYFCESSLGCNGTFRFSVANFTATGTGVCASTNGASWTTGTLCGVESVFGVANAATTLYDGTFDNAYYSGNGTTGNLWSCAADNGGGGGATLNSNAPKLVRSPISSFNATTPLLFNATNVIIPLTGTPYTGTCSPPTEIFDGTTDWLFLSVTANGNKTGCSGACLYNFNISSTTPGNATAGIAASGGTSGIIIDNTSAVAGASQIYYSPQNNQSCTTSGTTGGCAVQTSQSAP